MSAFDSSVIRPTPRRPYDVPSDEPTSSHPASGLSTPTDSYSKKSRSFVNLTSSTLAGIYTNSFDDPQTPTQLSRTSSSLNIPESNEQNGPIQPLLRTRNEKAAAALQRAHRKSYRKPAKEYLSLLLFRVFSLFALGVVYGVIVTHLHEHSSMDSSTSWTEINLDRYDLGFLAFWGIAGVGLGSLLPWLDGKDGLGLDNERKEKRVAQDWSAVVRSIGAFVGIAFAIRKLPWQSTLQVSLALALVNPFLWYLVDRTRSGFYFSTLVGIAGTVLLLQTNPTMIQTPDTLFPRNEAEIITGLGWSTESIGVGTWIASVLFCSCVCFGNIGRRLALKEREDE